MNYYWVIFLLQSVINCSIVFGKTIRGNFSDEYDSATEIEIFEHVSNCTVDVAVAYKANNITKFGYLLKNKKIVSRSRIITCPQAVKTILEEDEFIVQQYGNFLSIEAKQSSQQLIPAAFSNNLKDSITATTSKITILSNASIMNNENDLTSSDLKFFLYSFIDDWNDRIYIVYIFILKLILLLQNKKNIYDCLKSKKSKYFHDEIRKNQQIIE